MVSVYKTTHWYKDRVFALLEKLKSYGYSIDSLLIFEHCIFSTEDLFISKIEDSFDIQDYSSLVKFFLPKLTISYYLGVSKFSKLFFSPKENNLHIKDMFCLGKGCAVFDNCGEVKFLLDTSFCTPVVFIKKTGYEIRLCNKFGMINKIIAKGESFTEFLDDLNSRRDFYIIQESKVSEEIMYENIRKNILSWFKKKKLKEYDMFMVRNFKNLEGKEFVEAILK